MYMNIYIYLILQSLKSQGLKSNPQQIAQAIVENIPKNDFIEKVDNEV